MLFQSQAFLLAFLPATLAIWYALAGSTIAREWALIALSMIFYAWWDVRFLPLLVGQTTVSWLAAEIYIRTGQRWLLGLAIAANLAVLVFFKYSAFLAASLIAATGLAVPVPSILLPIGISFFTFEIVSYLVDFGWRGAPRYPLRRFALFVILFPRLIAGPIVRHHEIMPQFDLDPRREGLAERLGKGATLLVIGLAAKVFLADRLARVADSAFEVAKSQIPNLGTAWSGAIAFSFQLFLDFSAYSMMAIGIALMLGLALPENFSTPYRATSLRDFWQRWHMTLSRYLRDYVYIPLGGSRLGMPRFIMATAVTMGLCGFWHGAGWTFVAWGFLHGSGLIANRAWRQTGLRMPDAMAWGLTMLFVIIGWVLFRAPDFGTAWSMLAGMTGAGGLNGALQQPVLLAVAGAVSMSGLTSSAMVLARLKPHPGWAAVAAVAAVAVILDVGRGKPQTFIYFQF